MSDYTPEEDFTPPPVPTTKPNFFAPLLKTGEGLQHLLLYSPFHKGPLRNVFSEEFFFENLVHVEDQDFKAYISQVENFVFSNSSMLSLEGHSGVGKTTFVRYFEHTHKGSLNVNFIDCADYAVSTINIYGFKFQESHLRALDSAIAEATSESAKAELRAIREGIVEDIVASEQNNSITWILRNYIKSIGLSRVTRARFVRFLKRNRTALTDFFSGSVRDHLVKLPSLVKDNENDADLLEDIIDAMQTIDGFLLLYIVIEYLRHHGFNRNQPEVVIFDNLDAIPIDLLHKDFINLFENSQKAFGDICKRINRDNSDYEFRQDHKFIFCVREANNATIAEHKENFVRVVYKCKPTFYRNILVKRLNFYINRIELPGGRYSAVRKLVSLLNFLTDQGYFTNVLIPAFNMDYRRWSVALHDAIENFVPDVEQSHRRCPDGADWSGVFNIEFEDLPAQQITPFSLKRETQTPDIQLKASVAQGDREGFYGSVLSRVIARLHSTEFFHSEALDPNQGYCLAARMLLTFILNKSGVSKSGDLIGASNRYDEVKLSLVLHHTQELYSWQEVIKSLKDLYDVEREDQATYLVRFKHSKIHGKSAFDDIETMLKDENQWQFLQNFATLIISPAGFVFLRDLIVHYEFYAALANVRNPLFLYSGELITTDSPTPQYDFHDSVLKTYRLVERHEELMRRFYNAKFKAAGAEKYLSSAFAFKHHKGIAGLFHITRIVIAHVTYLDQYRQWLMRRSGTDDLTSKRALSSELFEVMRNYLALLARWEHKDAEMDSFRSTVTTNIEHLEKDPNQLDLSVV